ncbi:hypothetical protein FSP39_008010 [Pinctada imbricata]|uniref:B box-type domain-containing protein n=1 Tax=Pinctada imbricata TaxID=66713 RepID=A0AA88XDD4_PINIB|nr:hypothetical protein FSP39_008010 [Pinctada imbricata]
MAKAPESVDEQVATLYQYPVITPCDLCETKEDVNSFCRNCSQNLCEDCKRLHLRSTVSRDHNVVHISEGKSSESEATACTKHGERLFFYCRTCSVLFCPKCLDPTHKNHDFLDTDKYAKELQSKVALMIEEKSKMVEESRRHVEHIEENKKNYADACIDSKTSVMETAKFLRSEVDRIEAELLSTICHHESQGFSRFDKAKQEEQAIEEELQESLDKLIRSSKKHDNISLVAYASKIFNEFQTRKNNDESESESKPDIPSFLVLKVEFKSSRCSKDAISKLFGSLRNQHVEVSKKYIAESTKKLPETLTDWKDTSERLQNISEPEITNTSQLCLCQRRNTALIERVANKCTYCKKPFK